MHESNGPSALEKELLRYVSAHPDAADTPEGIQHWWLEDGMARYRLHDVERALERLVLAGVLMRKLLPDGRVLYVAAT